MKNKNGGNAGAIVGTAATVAAVSAAAYLLFGPEAKKNRKAVRGWAVKMKGEMIEKFEDAQHITEPVYHAIVDQVQAKYAAIKGVDQEELKGIVTDIRKHWKAMSKASSPKAKKAEVKTKKAVAKAKKEIINVVAKAKAKAKPKTKK